MQHSGTIGATIEDLEGLPTDGNFDLTYHRGAARRKQQ